MAGEVLGMEREIKRSLGILEGRCDSFVSAMELVTQRIDALEKRFDSELKALVWSVRRGS